MRDLNTTWASLGAVECSAATPDTFLGVQDLQAGGCSSVTAVKDEAVCANNGCRTEILTICPEHRAAGRTGRTQDALGGLIKACTVFLTLQALTSRLMAFGDEERHNFAVSRKERLHVDNKVLLQWEALDGLNCDGFLRVQVLDESLASQTVATIDTHRIRPTNTVST